MPEVDLTNCDREPIHVIGHVQPHGVLLALDPQALTVLQASASAASYLGTPPEALLGRSFLDLLVAERVESWMNALGEARLDGNPTHLAVERVNGCGPFHLVAHIHDDVLIVEIEPASEEENRDYGSLPRRMLRNLQVAQGSQAYYDAVVHEARMLTGFDRVMLYRFTAEGTGVVVAEAAEPHLEPFLGLHYPASDIPQQARRLFALNTVRLYPDVDYALSPIVPPLNPLTGRPLDMTYCVLRGVSIMHTEYLRNMGVKASMALAITQGDRLWGLIALHHHAVRELSYPDRAACELLAGLVSMQVVEKERGEGGESRDRMRDTFDRLAGQIRTTSSIADALVAGEATVWSLIDSGGAAFVTKEEIRRLGETPSESEVRALVDWLDVHQAESIWMGEGLSAHYPPAESFARIASGLLSIQVSQAAGTYVLWFRPERAQTVRWAGDPNKPVEASEFGDRLSPRRSFAVWREEVARRAEPWTEDEKGVAERLRLELVEALIHRTDAILRLNDELARRNEDLDTFAHVAAHDLKEPLRGIRNYAGFLQEDYSHCLDEEGRDQIGTILRLSGRLEGLLDSLLHFARISREDLTESRFDLGQAVDEAQALLSDPIRRTNAEVLVHGTLPLVRGDLDLTIEVIVNLMTNALKYNEERPRLEFSILPRTEKDPIVLALRDNGIGIPKRHHDAIFTLFKRLHAKEAYGGGTGMGLTIVKKAMERQGGRVRLESDLGEGTTFYLEFAP